MDLIAHNRMRGWRGPRRVVVTRPQGTTGGQPKKAEPQESCRTDLEVSSDRYDAWGSMTASLIPKHAALIERDAELEIVDRLLANASALVGDGQLCVVEGTTGIGKSRLLAEARGRAERAGFVVLTARGAELERDHPFGLVLRLFEACVARSPSAERRRLLRGKAGLAASLLGIRARCDATAPPVSDFALLDGLYWCVVNLSERRPVALLVDDAHAADPASLRFLNYVSERLRDVRVAMMLTIRSGDVGVDEELVKRLVAGATHALQLQALSPGGVAGMSEHAGSAARGASEALETVWALADGNPFIVEALLQENPQRQAPGPAHPLATDLPRAPDRVRLRFALRLAALGPEAVALARACALVGDGHSLAEAARVAGLPRSATEVGRLVSAGFLAQADPIKFASPIVRSAIYEEIPAGDRQRSHAVAAELLDGSGADSEHVAHHLLLGGPVTEPWAFSALATDARRAAAKGQRDTATTLLRHAVTSGPPAGQRSSILIDLGLLEAASGKTTCLIRFERALDAATGLKDQARGLCARGQTLYSYGRHREAAEAFLQAAELARDQDADLALELDSAYLGAALQVLPELGNALRRMTSLERTIRPTEPGSAAQQAVLAILALHRALGRRPVVEKSELAKLALGGGTPPNAQTSGGVVVNLAAVALMLCDQDDDGTAILDEAVRDARGRGATLAFAEASALRALLAYRGGRIENGSRDAKAASDCVGLGWKSLGPLAHATLAHCLIERDETGAAETVLAAGETLLGRDSKIPNAWFYVARGRLHQLRGRAGAALEDFLMAGTILAPYGVSDNPALLSWRGPAALAARAAGDERAGELIETEIAKARALGLGRPLGSALRCRALLAEPPAAENDLGDAISLLEETDARLELSRALVDLGALQRRTGRRVACRQALTRGLKLANEAGALALAARALGELRASGARPRSDADTGDGLTPGERRVAELAASGHTNREIAEQLVISKNTVAWHMRQIFRKLGLRSRDELPELLGAPRAEQCWRELPSRTTTGT